MGLSSSISNFTPATNQIIQNTYNFLGANVGYTNCYSWQTYTKCNVTMGIN